MLATGPKGHPRDRPSMDELDIGGRRLHPGATPPPSLQRLALSQFLPDSDGDFKQTIVCIVQSWL